MVVLLRCKRTMYLACRWCLQVMGTVACVQQFVGDLRDSGWVTGMQRAGSCELSKALYQRTEGK
jgi:hypothetical protein